MRKIAQRLALPLGLLLLAQGAQADDQKGAGLTGDWGGARSELEREGLAINAALVFEGAYNATGGDRSRLDQAGQLSLGAKGDLEKLLGIPDAQLTVIVTKREGTDLGADTGLAPLQQVQEVYGRGNIWRLTELSYDQRFLDGGLDLKLGRINPGSDFAAFACDFENLTFCGAAPGNVAGDYWMNAPVSQWGTRAKAQLQETLYLEAGAYQVDPANADRGFHLGAGGKGVLVPVELGWSPTERLPGTYKFGAWYSTANAADAILDMNRNLQIVTGAPALQRDDSFGGYVNFEQQVTGDEPGGRGLSLFLNALVGDRRTLALDRQMAIGASYAGPFESRPQDKIALALGVTHVNDRVHDAEVQSNALGLVPPVAEQRSEYVGELDYQAKVTGWLSLDPNLQLIHDPGGDEDAQDALVIGLKAALTL